MQKQDVLQPLSQFKVTGNVLLWKVSDKHAKGNNQIEDDQL